MFLVVTMTGWAKTPRYMVTRSYAGDGVFLCRHEGRWLSMSFM